MMILSPPFLVFLSFHIVKSLSTDTLRPKDLLTINNTLASASGIFELGFFSDGFLGTYYLGIWFKDDPNKRPVWVNRGNPLRDSSAVLQIRQDGNLVLTDKQFIPLIVNTRTLATSRNTSAKLLDMGNFVLIQEGKILWQSFDYPTDTFLPGMRIGWFGLNTNQSREIILTSCLSPNSPIRGAFTLGVNNNGSKKLSVWREDGVNFDIGSWDRHVFRFIFENSSNKYNLSNVSNGNETYFSFRTLGKYVSTWFVMSSIGQLDEYTMLNGSISLVSHPLCEDSKGSNTSRCLTSIPSMCDGGNNFSRMNGALVNSSYVNTLYIGENECRIMCQSNCICTAYAYNQDGQLVCQFYYGTRKDLSSFVAQGKGTIFSRGVTLSGNGCRKKRRIWLIIVGVQASLLALILVSSLCYFHNRKCNNKGNQARTEEDRVSSCELRLLQMGFQTSPTCEVSRENKIIHSQQKDQNLPLFSYSKIEISTDHFAPTNKLGEGGFGPVYKGKLPQGQEVAVKRLSRLSRQGLEEFKNEAMLISKLQHKNLVRLLGCCIEGEESILVYEYMPNKSLDLFLFDPAKREILDWSKRINIIEGIAQGILYLHKHSRLRIIHRDLKTSNILLDADLNPKISDFGMARVFEENETRAKTRRIVGTWGYMSPEYVIDGLFSEKSDVFSFGVILLEISSGKKNIAFYDCDHSMNLLANAWNTWKLGKTHEFIDKTLTSSSSQTSIMRCLQLGLLCVQERAMYRPTMSDVISMLNNESIVLPIPREPAFLLQTTDYESTSTSRQRQHSINDMTISEIFVR